MENVELRELLGLVWKKAPHCQALELSDELDAKEARLALLNTDMNIDSGGDLDVKNDTENRDVAGDIDFDDSPDYEEFSHISVRMAQVASAKAKSSILDGIYKPRNAAPMHLRSAEKRGL